MKLPAQLTLPFGIGLGVLALIALLVLAWNFDPFGRRERAEEKAATATVQADTNQAAATIAGQAAVETRIIHETTERIVHDVQAAPSASAPLPDDLRAALCAGLSELRNGKPGCVDPGSPEPG